jgi:hypothetical protein
LPIDRAELVQRVRERVATFTLRGPGAERDVRALCDLVELCFESNCAHCYDLLKQRERAAEPVTYPRRILPPERSE